MSSADLGLASLDGLRRGETRRDTLHGSAAERTEADRRRGERNGLKRHGPKRNEARAPLSEPRCRVRRKGPFHWAELGGANGPLRTLRTFENLETFELLGVLVTRTLQSSGGSPLGAIFTRRGSNRASGSTRSLWAAMTSSMSL